MQTSTAYDPFGTVTARSGAPSLLGYQGAYTGNVNMLARWYQPGTGTFTSRDTATLDPSPSVQANRYTYANASPLTGINPTGHSTVPGGSLQEAGPGYAGCIASDGVCHETFVHERYRSDLVNSPGYDYLYGPGFSKEERERLGWKVMPNGRLVDQPNFWFADADVQEAYMLGWFPAMEQRDRDALWVAVGGMDSMVPMVAAAEVGDDPRVPSCVQAMASNRQASCGDFPNLDIYMEFLQFAKDIAASAKSNGVDKNALMAVLLYENSFAEGRIGKPAWWFGL
ncbi:RHS repeat-associated core domain-containing protein [Nonomuraea jiangxiensis]